MSMVEELLKMKLRLFIGIAWRRIKAMRQGSTISVPCTKRAVELLETKQQLLIGTAGQQTRVMQEHS